MLFVDDYLLSSELLSISAVGRKQGASQLITRSTRHTLKSPKIMWRVERRVKRCCDELTVWRLDCVTSWPCILMSVWLWIIFAAHFRAFLHTKWKEISPRLTHHPFTQLSRPTSVLPFSEQMADVDLRLCKFNSCDKLRLCSKYAFWVGLKGALKQFFSLAIAGHILQPAYKCCHWGSLSCREVGLIRDHTLMRPDASQLLCAVRLLACELTVWRLHCVTSWLCEKYVPVTSWPVMSWPSDEMTVWRDDRVTSWLVAHTQVLILACCLAHLLAGLSVCPEGVLWRNG